MPKSNSQQKNTPDAHTRRQQVGAERRGAGGIAKGKDRPEGPESSRREAFFKLWESVKINRPEHTPAVHKTNGLRNSREEQPHPRSSKEAGGGARGKLSPREAAHCL